MAKYLIIVSRFNELVTKSLLEGALSSFENAGVGPDNLETIWVPGSFEMPALAARAARSRNYAAVVCLGCVIRGETPHFDYVASQAASGLMKVSIETETPVIFGVLTTENEEQALARCGLKGGNKGRDAALAAVEMTKAFQRFSEETQH